MAIANPLEPFLWGSGGQAMTPAQIARQREVASLLAQGIGDTSPVDHWLQGVPRLVNALGAGLRESRADAAEQAGRDAYQEKWDQVFGGGSTSPVAAALAEPATAAQATEEMGNGFLASVIGSESGGNWAASNDEIGAGGAPGHFGRLQFGQARLQDAKNAGIIPASMTPEQFMASPEAQQSVEAWHFADIDKQAQDLGLTSYVGQIVGGAPITMDAIRAMAHLGGIGGAQQFLESGGAYNPEDANGTSLLDYALQHGGTGGGGPRTQVAPADMAQLLGLASDPFASDAQEQIVMSLIGQQMEQSQPDWQTIESGGDVYRYNANDPNSRPEMFFDAPDVVPEPTETMRNLEFRAGQAGLVPGTPEYQEFMRTGGSGPQIVNNVMPNGQPLPEPPFGMDYRRNADGTVAIDENGMPEIVQLPGGPQAIEAAAAADAAAAAGDQAAVTTDTITQEAGKARSLISPFTTGPGGWVFANLPWSEGSTLLNHVNSLKSIAAAENIQAMREASPTGAALGNASDRDITLLQDKAGALDPRSPSFPQQLDDYERTLLRIVHGQEAGDALFEQSRPVRTITSEEEYNALPSGTVFKAPDGTVRKKP